MKMCYVYIIDFYVVLKIFLINYEICWEMKRIWKYIMRDNVVRKINVSCFFLYEDINVEVFKFMFYELEWVFVKDGKENVFMRDKLGMRVFWERGNK